METVRLDKWLWAVRLCKTRQAATDACRLQRVRMGGQEAKPARPIRAGDIIEVQQEDVVRTVKVKAVLDRRVGAKVVAGYLEDLTPAEVWERAARSRQERALNRQASPLTKPSKRDRRVLDSFLAEVKRSAGILMEGDDGDGEDDGDGMEGN